MISDEIWVRLDPGAGMVSGIGYRRWFMAGIAAMLVAAGWLSGAISPHLSSGDNDSGQIYVRKDEIGRPQRTETTIQQTFVNDGWLPVTITGVGVPAHDDYRLLAAEPRDHGGFPRTVPSGGSISLTLVMSVGDCAAVMEEVVPVVFEVERWWGRSAADVVSEDGEPPWFSSFSAEECQ
ncbi:hypothetical protein [Nonomuraea basaltis]|uniref:hypothetical protein n=1 Tax=Nonomuraea basaltis TaxID=2495887 RepID=UPI00110C46E1|nr:hypothetical protein [Nonomuraea basaltis]TMR98056.1 hypothetical protein EJK15_14630 [Nonomuraea basaltis]